MSALALFLAQLATALFTEQRKGVRMQFVTSYVIVASLTVVMIFLITFTTRHRGTRITGTWVSLCSLLLFAVFVCLAYADGLPGQQALPLRVTRYQVIGKDKTPNGLSGIEAIVPISDQNLGDKDIVSASSGSLRLRVEWNKKTYPDWELKQSQVSEVTPLGANIDSAASAEVCDGTEETTVCVSGMTDKTRYRLRLIFLPAGKEFNAWLSERDTKKKSLLYDRLVSSFEKKAEDDRKSMAQNAAIQVHVDRKDAGMTK